MQNLVLGFFVTTPLAFFPVMLYHIYLLVQWGFLVRFLVWRRVSMKKIVSVSGKIVGDCLAIGTTPSGLLIVCSGPVIESSMPPSMAEIISDALVQRCPVAAVPDPSGRAGRN